VRVYKGHDPESKKRKYLNQTATADCATPRLISTRCSASETAAGNLDLSKQTLMSSWIGGWGFAPNRSCLRRAYDYEGLLRRYVRPAPGGKALAICVRHPIAPSRHVGPHLSAPGTPSGIPAKLYTHILWIRYTSAGRSTTRTFSRKAGYGCAQLPSITIKSAESCRWGSFQPNTNVTTVQIS